MYFDDRLATVLRTGVGSDRAARTQFRQLLDLLGTLPSAARGPLVDNAYARLDMLAERLKPAERGAMIREPGVRLTSPRLVAALARDEAEVASATMAAARLPDEQWQALIPQLPMAARGFLRHRRDLENGANEVLQRLGIGDLVLPCPDVLELSDSLPLESSLDETDISALGWPQPGTPRPERERDDSSDGDSLAIGALVRRIEAFQRARGGVAAPPPHGADTPRLPLEEPQDTRTRSVPAAFDFSTDTAGRINWCDPAVAPMAVGLALANEAPDAPAQGERAMLDAMRHRQPVHGATIAITGAPAIAGQWRIDATPRFGKETGRFLGYYGRMRRLPAAAQQAPSPVDPMADRMRQILHELRTPVNAIQGFAEIIQQQLYGPAPHEYRALAATIASDAARILAGFDELDRLARLESGALELDEGTSDFAAILANLAVQVRPALQARGSAIAVWGTDEPALVPLAQGDAEKLGWRLMATLAAEASAGEEIDLHVAREGTRAIFAVELPAGLASAADVFAAALPAGQRAISAGMFGASFTLRLARAEARAAGGDLTQEDDMLRLVLPLLTAHDAVHSQSSQDTEGAGGQAA
ncbi:MAG: HAMP domain-containing sensor histidine kinase [Novosphingobium sp.]|nr:HAMP domain-containing sensor histidine kinase [Novosphingobium sp.]